MSKLLVNAPSGAQEIIEVGEGGGYFDAARVLWDERDDGALPAITLGGMVRKGGALVSSQARMDEHTATVTPPTPSQFDLDKARYEKRAAVKNDLIAYMAADNMSRVRSGVWTVPQLMSLMDDPAVSAANAYMSTLSFELAAQAIESAATPLLTPEIRADWVARLQAHFYLEG